jgi:hypothetical protein
MISPHLANIQNGVLRVGRELCRTARILTKTRRDENTSRIYHKTPRVWMGKSPGRHLNFRWSTAEVRPPVVTG